MHQNGCLKIALEKINYTHIETTNGKETLKENRELHTLSGKAEDILDYLESLKTYFELTRQVGHTTAMLKGADNCDCLVLVHNNEMGKHLQEMSGKEKKSKICNKSNYRTSWLQ